MMPGNTPVEARRLAFERWYRLLGHGTLSLDRHEIGGYAFEDVQNMWSSWSAGWEAHGEYEEKIPKGGLCQHSWRFLRSEVSDPFDPSIAIDRFYCVKCLERKGAPRKVVKP